MPMLAMLRPFIEKLFVPAMYGRMPTQAQIQHEMAKFLALVQRKHDSRTQQHLETIACALDAWVAEERSCPMSSLVTKAHYFAVQKVVQAGGLNCHLQTCLLH